MGRLTEKPNRAIYGYHGSPRKKFKLLKRFQKKSMAQHAQGNLAASGLFYARVTRAHRSQWPRGWDDCYDLWVKER